MSKFNTLEFFESPIKNHEEEPVAPFDITTIDTKFDADFKLFGEFNAEAYCFCLIKKLHKIAKEELIPFFRYQINQLQNPVFWLKTLDNLIKINTHIVEEIFCKNKYNHCKSILQTLKEIQYDVSKKQEQESTRFSIKHLQEKLAQCSSYEQQEQTLIELETEFNHYNQQSFVNLSCFSKHLEYERERLAKMKTLNPKLIQPSGNSIKQEKLQINCNINQLVSMFFEASYNLNYINFEQTKLAKFICNNFLDKHGKELSYRTVETILDPNRPEKRPPESKRMHFGV
jgi:hypothetical protein